MRVLKINFDKLSGGTQYDLVQATRKELNDHISMYNEMLTEYSSEDGKAYHDIKGWRDSAITERNKIDTLKSISIQLNGLSPACQTKLINRIKGVLNRVANDIQEVLPRYSEGDAYNDMKGWMEAAIEQRDSIPYV